MLCRQPSLILSLFTIRFPLALARDISLKLFFSILEAS
jgi:hypothetical protein